MVALKRKWRKRGKHCCCRWTTGRYSMTCVVSCFLAACFNTLVLLHKMKVINLVNPMEPPADCPKHPQYAPFMVETVPRESSALFWSTKNEQNATQSLATCQFHHMDKFNYHFPHTMQQLYRCWSLWRNQSNPILIFPKKQLPANPFLEGYVGKLTNRVNLTLQRTGSGHLPRVPNNTINVQEIQCGGEIPSYAFERPDDAAQLRDLFLPNATQSCNALPRISILNRHRKREWTNADKIRIQYQGQQLPMRTEVFNDKTFQEQIEFFHETDILIGPHGAQLTGIPFMPDCGAVIELFSHYYLPHFFGSLATASQISHGYIYTINDHSAMTSQRTRQKIRNCPVSPPPAIVEHAIATMIDKWQTCCHSRYPKS